MTQYGLLLTVKLLLESEPTIKHESESGNDPTHRTYRNLQNLENNSEQPLTMDKNLHSRSETNKKH